MCIRDSHYSGAKALDQNVAMIDQFLRNSTALRRFQVKVHDRAAALNQVSDIAWLGLRTIDANDLSAHVREQHASEWGRAQTCKFQHPQTTKWPGESALGPMAQQLGGVRGFRRVHLDS